MSEITEEKKRTITPKGKVDYAEKMTFKAFKDVHFKTPLEDEATNEQFSYTVQVNPDSMTRSFAIKTVGNKKIRSANGSGEAAGFDAETYTFDLIFDGTGALGISTIGKAAENFQKFLCTVYAKKSLKAEKKEANFVELHYCGETFYCKMSSLSAKYTLFGRDGSPLRIKASCTFKSVDKDKPDPKPSKPKQDKCAPQLPPQSDPCAKVGARDSFKETEEAAKQNGSPSLMNCNYSC